MKVQIVNIRIYKISYFLFFMFFFAKQKRNLARQALHSL